MILLDDLERGTILEFTNPTEGVYTNGCSYQVINVTDRNNIIITDNAGYPHDWDIDHVQKQFKIKSV